MAVENNFDVKLARAQAAAAAQDTIAEEAAFDPALGLSAARSGGQNPGDSAFSNPADNRYGTVEGEVSVSGKAPIGAQYKAAVTASGEDSNSSFATLNPKYRTALILEITQPLLQGAGERVTTWRAVMARTTEAVERERLRAALADVAAATQEAYWELVFRVEDLGVARESLEWARDLERRARAQVEVGALAPMEIVQAQASVATREETVIAAENAIHEATDELLRLMNPGANSPWWSEGIAPAQTALDAAPEPLNLHAHVANALERRPELAAARLELENRKVTLVYQRDRRWPTLDLVATLRLNGLRGEARDVESLLPGDDAPVTMDGGWNDSLRDAFTGEARDYRVGLSFTYPFGGRAGRAGAARAEIDLQAQALRLASLERQIILETRDAARRIENGVKQTQAAAAARLLAEKRLEAETSKFEVGASTSFQVLEYQKELAAERSQELRAKVNLLKAQARLRRATGGGVLFAADSAG